MTLTSSGTENKQEVAMSAFCSMVAVGAPHVSVVFLGPVLWSVGISLTEESWGLIVAIDWLIDRFQTVVNVAGDVSSFVNTPL